MFAARDADRCLPEEAASDQARLSPETPRKSEYDRSSHLCDKVTRTLLDRAGGTAALLDVASNPFSGALAQIATIRHALGCPKNDGEAGIMQDYGCGKEPLMNLCKRSDEEYGTGERVAGLALVEVGVGATT